MDEEEDGDSSNERSAAATEKSGSLPFDAQEKETHAEFGSAGEFDYISMLQIVPCLFSFSASADTLSIRSDIRYIEIFGVEVSVWILAVYCV